MSLAIGVVQKDYIIAASDSSVVEFLYKDGTIERTGKMIPTDLKSNKVEKISDKVMLLSTGNSLLTKIMKVELKSRVKNNSDLKECMEEATRIFTEMKNKVSPYHLEKILSNFYEVYKFKANEQTVQRVLDMVNDPVEFTAYLVGFNKNGKTGLFSVHENKYMETPEEEVKGYPVVVAGEQRSYVDDPKYIDDYHNLWKRMLTFPVEERNFENFKNAILLVHAQISKFRKNVSSDCNFQVLVKENDEIRHAAFTMDTSPLYELIKEPQK